MFGGSTPSPNSITDVEVPRLLQDIVQRFEPEGGLADILGPVVTKLVFHPCLFREEGLAASDPRWRGVLTGLEALVAHKQIAAVITKLDDWIPADATAATFETKSLMGPLLRLNVFSREWVRGLSNFDRCKAKAEARYKPYITKMYFSNSETRPAVDIESSQGSLRGTLKSLQVIHSWQTEVWCLFSLVDPISDIQLYRPSVTRVSGGCVIILLSCYFSQYEKSGYAGMLDHPLMMFVSLPDARRG